MSRNAPIKQETQGVSPFAVEWFRVTARLESAASLGFVTLQANTWLPNLFGLVALREARELFRRGVFDHGRSPADYELFAFLGFAQRALPGQGHGLELLRHPRAARRVLAFGFFF